MPQSKTKHKVATANEVSKYQIFSFKTPWNTLQKPFKVKQTFHTEIYEAHNMGEKIYKASEVKLMLVK